MMGAQALSNQGPFTSLMADSQQLSADLDAAAATWQQLVAARQELLQLVRYDFMSLTDPGVT